MPWLVPIIPSRSKSIKTTSITKTARTNIERTVYSRFKNAIAPSLIRLPMFRTSSLSTFILCTLKKRIPATNREIIEAITP